MFLRPLYFMIIALAVPLKLVAAEWTALPALLPKGTQLSYMVVDPDKGKVIAQSQQSVLRTPASVQKLLTASAAKLYLGEKFRYRSSLEGQPDKIKNNQYRGNIRFRFSGDPSLSRADIRNMFKQLKALGIHRINGNVLLNQDRFSGYQWSEGQAWNDLGVCYSAPASTIIVNKNCVLGNLSVTSGNAEKARLFIPGYEPLTISSDVSVLTQQQRREQFCALNLTRNDHNHYHLWGCMVARKRPLALAFAVNDPFNYAQQIIAAELAALNIRLTGEIKLDNSHATASVPSENILVSHQSPSLDELLEIMMKESDNLIADSLFKTLGGVYFQRAGNFRNGARAVKLILKEYGINLENAYLADGSGLSRHNLMSAELLMAVLNYVYKNESSLQLLSTFAVAGVDGTLKNHRAMRGELFSGKVRAKTGSMKGVSNLVGVASSSSGERLFVLMINAYNLSAAANDETDKASKELFQKAFFKTLMEG